MDDPLTRAGEYNFCFLLWHVTNCIYSLHVEWAKAKARANRWEEEVILLDEEMRMCSNFVIEGVWWKEQILVTRAYSQLTEGLRAYAEEQADMERRIRESWGNKWAKARELAQPILRAALGEAPATGLEVAEGSVGIIELEIEETMTPGGRFRFRGVAFSHELSYLISQSYLVLFWSLS